VRRLKGSQDPLFGGKSLIFEFTGNSKVPKSGPLKTTSLADARALNSPLSML
jgi:hypothetical protein